MIILLGRTCSGKDTIVSKLISLYKYKKIIAYTTRPIRKGEKQNKAYHFISENDFKQKIENGFFAEWKSYDTEFGTWYYGTALNDLNNADDKSIVILTPQGFRDIKEKVDNEIVSIYIYSNNKTIQERLIDRGDDPNEAKRRLTKDNEDFKGIENEVDKIFYNNVNTNIIDVVENIIGYLNVRKEVKKSRT